jgi:hypothetical protein
VPIDIDRRRDADQSLGAPADARSLTSTRIAAAIAGAHRARDARTIAR